MATAIKCGNCKGSHGSAREVRECYGHASPTQQYEAQKAQAKAAVAGATDKQVAFLETLLAERNHGWDAAKVLEGLRASKKAASEAIGTLLGMPKLAGASAEGKAQPAELEDGIYLKDGTYFKVYHAVHGSGSQVTKALVIVDNEDGTHSAEWDYRGRKPLHSLTAEHMLDQEAAAAFGKLYGFCVRCGRTLTREESLHVGYGKVCAGHQGWWYPTKEEMRQLAATA